MRMPFPVPPPGTSMPEPKALAPAVSPSSYVHHRGRRAAAAPCCANASAPRVSDGRGLVRLACALAAGGGVAIAVEEMLRLSLPLMLTGSGCWFLSVLAWELATGRFR